VQMPIYDPLLKQVENDGRYGILADFRRRAASGFFDDQGVVFFDFARFSEYSGDYRYYVDVIHPTEPVVSAMLVAMHRDPRFRRLLPRLDVPALAERLRADRGAAEHVDLYGYEY
jgi:hypothetical protein